MLPQTWTQITVLLTAVLPGFVYQVSRRRVGGPDPEARDLGERLLHAIAASAVFASVYAVVLGPAILDRVRRPQLAIDEIRELGWMFLLLVVVVPWAAARVRFYVTTSQWWGRLRTWGVGTFKLRRQWDPTPSAWDFAFNRASVGWVRVQTPHGWVGGWFGEDSFASSFPDPQELFIEVGYIMEEDGTFSSEISAPGGVLVNCREVRRVDFIPAESEPEEQEGP
ncbi:DUF6338 family protein [Cellulosimicrobium sp. TH-20]|uniref:DUF6338 family protein n=1 Tax=Cellulosimicrobium sp. TH-20 TaxID=1980001 RepID=UPI0012F9D0D3|nr:DUF6338 family protein [Cellulosimicrobium sp. TH-20]